MLDLVDDLLRAEEVAESLLVTLFVEGSLEALEFVVERSSYP
jgi:hypothetical protein